MDSAARLSPPTGVKRINLLTLHFQFITKLSGEGAEYSTVKYFAYVFLYIVKTFSTTKV